MTQDEEETRFVPLAERLIREAQERGEFEDLDGAGEPIPDLDEPYDPSWWAKAWVARELAPPELRDLQARIREELMNLSQLRDEQETRRRLEALNHLIDTVRRRIPDESIPDIDVDAAIELWRRGHELT